MNALFFEKKLILAATKQSYACKFNSCEIDRDRPVYFFGDEIQNLQTLAM